jgi:hypothetical protein
MARALTECRAFLEEARGVRLQGGGEGEGEARRGALVALQTLSSSTMQKRVTRVWRGSHVKDSRAFQFCVGKISENEQLFGWGVFAILGGLSNDSNHHQS